MKKAKKLLVLASVGVLSVTLYACNNNNTGMVTKENLNTQNNMENVSALESSLNNLEDAVNKYNNVNTNELTISSIAPSYGETNYITSNGATQGSEYYSYLNKMNGVYNSNVSVSTGSSRLNQSKSDVINSINNLRKTLNNTNQQNVDSSKKEVVDLYSTTFNRIAENLNNLSEGYNNTLTNYRNLNLENLDLTNAKYSAILYEMELANSNLETSKKALDALLSYLTPTTNINQQSNNLINQNQNTMNNQSGVYTNNKMQRMNDRITNNNLPSNRDTTTNQTQNNNGIRTLEETNVSNTNFTNTNNATTTTDNNNQDTAVTLPARPQPRLDFARRNGRILRRADRTGKPISRMPRLSDDTLQGDNMGQTTNTSQTTNFISYKPTAVAR